MTNLPIEPFLKIYTGLITQASTAAPTAIVLQNTLGAAIVWTRSETGIYLATLAGAFIEDKTFIQTTNNRFAGTTNQIFAERISANQIQIVAATYAFAPGDGLLDNTCIEIRIYK